MENYLSIISVPAIAAFVYVVISLIRLAVGKNEKFDRFVPIIAAVLGVVSGIVCYFLLPKVIPADNFLVAALIGGASGLSATGANQMIKQLAKSGADDKTVESSGDKSENADNEPENSGDENKNSDNNPETTNNAEKNENNL